ncbi:hypothetical protein SpCBS45565_g07199 [Spizellomyces sp. 'palustris']|nr:hypothetical protein SpCBS45565_g07199 [Spizellomyces sp. 'palustris']
MATLSQPKSTLSPQVLRAASPKPSKAVSYFQARPPTTPATATDVILSRRGSSTTTLPLPSITEIPVPSDILSTMHPDVMETIGPVWNRDLVRAIEREFLAVRMAWRPMRNLDRAEIERKSIAVAA